MSLMVSLGVGAIVDAFGDLAERNGADRQTIGQELLEETDSVGGP